MVCLYIESSMNMLVKGTTILDFIKVEEKPPQFIITLVKKTQTRTDDFEIESCQSALFKL